MRRSLLIILASSLILAACEEDRKTISTTTPSDDPTIVNPTPEPEPNVTLIDKDELCTGNETACDGYVLLTCGSDGKFIQTACGLNERCAKDGDIHRCMTQDEYDKLKNGGECDAGQSKCEVGKRLVCGEDFKYAVAEDCLAKGLECDDSGASAICNPGTSPKPEPECEANDVRCNGNVLQKCHDSGKYVDELNCGDSSQMCLMQNGQATCADSCTQGSTRCNGDKLETCNDNNEFIETPCADPSKQICKTQNGNASCADRDPEPECEGSVYRCHEGDIQQCVKGVYTTTSYCTATGASCEETSNGFICVTPKCTTGTTKCDAANTLLTCDADGKWIQTKCLLETPKKICQPDGGDGNTAACVAINTGTDTIDSDGDTIPDVIEGREVNRHSDDDGIPDYLDTDSDNDTIPDSVEANNGGDLNVPPDESDYDGLPNYIDTDSDNNGIPDAVEAGADKTHPIDKDSDTVPDYLDYDNDGDGFSDIEEIRGLIASDPAPAAGQYSGKCNGSSLQGNADSPLDCDHNNVADYMDTDSDGDGLSDLIEGSILKNGLFTRYMVDSDGDGITDYDECFPKDAKDVRIRCKATETTCKGVSDGVCQDSDGDGVPDMLELDSDGDGLPDNHEVSLGSNPRLTDSDGDNAHDIVEYAICLEDAGVNSTNSCPAMIDVGEYPQKNGNFVFTTPYKEKSDDPQALSLVPSIQTIDLFFAFDASTSMRAEVNSLKSSLNQMLIDLQCEDLGVACEENKDCKDAELEHSICSEKGRCITDPSYGDRCFDDMWTGLAGYSNLNSYKVLAPLKEGCEHTVDKLSKYENSSEAWAGMGSGNDEAAYQAPICSALTNGENTNFCSNSTTHNCATASGRVGCAGFRQSAIRIFLHAFDENQCFGRSSEPNHNTGNNKTKCDNIQNSVGSILSTRKIRYVGLYGDDVTHKINNVSHITNDYNDSNSVVANNIGIASGSTYTKTDGSTGTFIYRAVDNDLKDQAAAGIRDIAKSMPMEITSDVEDLDNSTNLNARRLVAELRVHTTSGSAQGKTCTPITQTPTSSTNDVGTILEGLAAMVPKDVNVLCYDVIPVDYQEIFPATDTVQIKKAKVKIMGDGSVLNSGVAYFVIPPKTEGSNE